MQKEVVIGIRLRKSPVLVPQDIVKPVLQDLRQRLSL